MSCQEISFARTDKKEGSDTKYFSFWNNKKKKKKKKN